MTGRRVIWYTVAAVVSQLDHGMTTVMMGKRWPSHNQFACALRERFVEF